MHAWKLRRSRWRDILVREQVFSNLSFSVPYPNLSDICCLCSGIRHISTYVHLSGSLNILFSYRCRNSILDKNSYFESIFPISSYCCFSSKIGVKLSGEMLCLVSTLWCSINFFFNWEKGIPDLQRPSSFWIEKLKMIDLKKLQIPLQERTNSLISKNFIVLKIHRVKQL